MFISKKKHQEAMSNLRRNQSDQEQWSEIWDLQHEVEELKKRVNKLEKKK